MSQGETIKAFFDSVADDYERFFSVEATPKVYPFGAKRTELVLARLTLLRGENQGPAKHLIDLGCGSGYLCTAAAELGFTVTGVDFSAGMLAKARALVAARGTDVDARVTFVEGDIARTGLPGASADAVTALGLIEYLTREGVAGFFAEASRLLRPGGRLVIETGNRLFNAASLNRFTQAEVASGNASGLLSELGRGFTVAPDLALFEAFVAKLKETLPELERAIALDRSDREAPPPATPDKIGTSIPIERLQHTPDELAATAAASGFATVEQIALHPHPMPPHVERTAPRFFNCLATAYEVFAATPLSFAWSSSFLSVFEKKA